MKALIERGSAGGSCVRQQCNGAICHAVARIPAAVAAVNSYGWHSIANNNEITDTSRSILLPVVVPTTFILRISYIHKPCNSLSVITRDYKIRWL